MDIDSIPPGADFVEVLEGWVAKCDVLLALIGPSWINALDPKSGRRRLDNPMDFVRIEIREALTRGIPVVPTLLDGAPLPSPEELPEDMQKLVRRQAEVVDFRTFGPDVERLIKKLGLGENDPRASANSTRLVGVRYVSPHPVSQSGEQAQLDVPRYPSWLAAILGTFRRPPLVAGPRQSASELPLTHSVQKPMLPESDVGQFYKDRVVQSLHATLTASELYEAYCEWCDTRQRQPFSMPKFVREFTELGVRRERIGQRVRYIGITLKQLPTHPRQ
jgi:hypothetical protein